MVHVTKEEMQNMSSETPTEQQLEDEAIADDDETSPSPGRGRPKLPPEQHRKNSITLSFTDEEHGDLMLLAAKDRKHLRVWARDILLEALKKGSQ